MTPIKQVVLLLNSGTCIIWNNIKFHNINLAKENVVPSRNPNYSLQIQITDLIYINENKIEDSFFNHEYTCLRENQDLCEN